MSDSPQNPPSGAAVEFHERREMPGGATPTRYDIQRLLDEGGMGKIHIAKDLNLRRDVVIKELKFCDDAGVIKEFLREVQITAQLDHPNIVPIYNVLDPQATDGKFAFTMKLIQGETLADVIEEARQRFNASAAEARKADREGALRHRLELFLKVCEALQYAHSRRVLHRDLKPANIMVGAFGEVYVMDWGLAYSPDVPTDEAGSIKGTPAYMAPEQVYGDLTLLGQDSDGFALGLILFELVSLRRAAMGRTTEEMLVHCAKGEFHPLTHHDPETKIHPDLIAIIQRAIQFDRTMRYPNVASMAADLQKFLHDEEISARPDNSVRKIVRWVGKNRAKTLVFVMVLITVASAAGLWAMASAYQIAEEQKKVAEHQQLIAENNHRIADQDKLIAEQKEATAQREKEEAVRKRTQAEQSRVREAQLSRFQAQVSARAYGIDEQFARSEDQVRGLADLTRLLLQNPPKGKARLYAYTDYDDPDERPEDAEVSPIYNKLVSLDHAVYKLAPGVDERDAKKRLRVIAPLQEHYLRMLLHSGDFLRGDHPKLATQASMARSRAEIRKRILVNGVPVRWTFIGLEDGIMFAYPGASGYSEDYDPRQRPWYKLAKDRKGVHWGTLYLDAQGQGLLMPCVTAIYDIGENFVGVAALEITLADVINDYMNHKSEGFVEAYLLDEAGHMIIRTSDLEGITEPSSDAEFVKGAVFRNPALIEAAQSQSSGILRDVRDGKVTLLGYQKLSALGWTYVEEVEATIVIKPRTVETPAPEKTDTPAPEDPPTTPKVP